MTRFLIGSVIIILGVVVLGYSAMKGGGALWLQAKKAFDQDPSTRPSSGLDKLAAQQIRVFAGLWLGQALMLIGFGIAITAPIP